MQAARHLQHIENTPFFFGQSRHTFSKMANLQRTCDGEQRRHSRQLGDDLFVFPDWKVRVSDVLLDGDRIAFVGTASATDQNGWFGQAPTQSRVEYRAVILLTIFDEKIIRDERIYDLTAVMQCLDKQKVK